MLTYTRNLPATFVPKYTVRDDGHIAGIIFRTAPNREWVYRGKYNMRADQLREIAGEMDRLRTAHKQ